MEIKKQPDLATFDAADIKEMIRECLRKQGYYVLQYQCPIPSLVVLVTKESGTIDNFHNE
jgi:hypothetical protein